MKFGKFALVFVLVMVLCLGAALAEDAEAIYQQGIEAWSAGDAAKSAELVAQAAELGYAPAQARLARAYFEADGVERDRALALEWCRKAAEANDLAGQELLGQFYDYGYGVVDADFAEAAKWYEKAAEQDEPEAMFRLARLLQDGLGVEQDEARADELFVRARELVEEHPEYPKANFILGMVYVYGLGVDADVDAGIEYLSQAAESGDSDAQYMLGSLLMGADGIIEPDVERGEALLNDSVAQDNVLAETYLGYLYFYGQGVAEDPERAVELFFAAAAQDDSNACTLLDVAYDRGRGVEADEAQALAWAERGAELGNPTAMSGVGVSYMFGKGVEIDYAKSCEYFRQAAELGDVTGQEAMGEFLERGLGAVEIDYAEAAQWYEKAIEQGDYEAMYRLGRLYAEGKGVERDEAKANELFTQVREAIEAEEPDDSGLRILAEMYDRGYGVEEDDARAAELYEQSNELCEATIHSSNYDALRGLATLYYKGSGVEQDYERARELYESAAQGGDPNAIYRLGYMCLNGEGGEKDEARGLELIRKAVALDEPSAQCYLGYLYANGIVVERDVDQAEELLEKAIAQGNLRASLDLVMLYGDEGGADEDYARVVEPLTRTAEAGDALAQSLLGYMYGEGHGVEKDYAESKKWLELAAEQNEPTALNNLGYMYEKGLGVERDYARAKEYYEASIDAGDTAAMADLGSLYLRGRGVDIDWEQAFQWFQRGAEAEYPENDALEWLGECYEFGWGTGIDYEKAADCYERAAEMDNAIAQYRLSWLLYNGWGVEKDEAREKELVAQALEALTSTPEDELSNHEKRTLAEIYLGGDSEEDQTKHGVELLSEVVDALGVGDLWAQGLLGGCYFEGYGVEQDYERAYELLIAGAKLGDAYCQSFAGYLYAMGLGTELDYEAAKNWYELSATQGYPNAMANLGEMYAKGEGVDVDLNQARAWYEKAAALGESYAAQMLEELDAQDEQDAQDAQEEQDAQDEQVAALPKVGDQMYGFTVKSVEPCPSMNGQAVEFVHDKTGAPLVWIANDSIDRAFSVGFRTLVNDDKGIPHIFEHAATSGSEKYPNADLFYAASYGTYNTYINASTYKDHTVYPLSSLSEDQLLRYVDYYMDGVYHPLLLHDDHTLRREAFRYDLPSADAELTLQGTVYSEMLGALTQDATTFYEAERAAFPGSAMGSITGGVPGSIETTTQQDLIDFHAAFYQPSNSMMVLYGDLEIGRFLELIDGEYLSHYERTEPDVSDSGYTPLTGDVVKEFAYPISADETPETMMVYMLPITDISLVGLNQLQLAVDTMMESGQPFDTLSRERLPGVSISAGILAEGQCSSVVFEVYGATAEQQDEVVSVIREGIAQTLESGLDPDLLASAVLQERFNQAYSADDQRAYQVVDSVISQWSIEGDAMAFLQDEVYRQNLQTYLDEGTFDAVLEQYLAEPDASCLVVSNGQPGLAEENDEALAQRLAEMKAAMSDEEIQALVDQHNDLEQWIADTQQSVSVAPLMAVSAHDLPEEVEVCTARDEDVDGLRVVSSVVDSDMAEIDIYLDASGLAAEQLDAGALAMNLLGLLPTEQYGEDELAVRIAGLTDGIWAQLEAIHMDDGSYMPRAHIYFSCFREDLDAAFDLMEEILLNTKFDAADVQEVCALYASQDLSNIQPRDYASSLAHAAFDEGYAYDQRVSYGRIRTEERVAGMDETELAAFIQDMQAALDVLRNGRNMIFTVAGSEENIAAATARASALREKLGDAEYEPVDYSTALAAPKYAAATYGSDAMYSYAVLPLEDSGMEYTGELKAGAAVAAARVLTPIYCGTYSVYTPSLYIDRMWFSMELYRDPRLRESFEEVLPTLGDAVRALDISQEELDGYITSAYSSLAMPMGPFTGAETAIQDALTGQDSFARKIQRMHELKQTTPEVMDKIADLLDALAESGSRSTVGSARLIADARDLFDEVDTWLTD